MVTIESAWAKYPDYCIELLPLTGVGQAWAGDVLLAESANCLRVTETKHVDRLYFPESDVRWELFEATDHHTVCPFKGQADYWSFTRGAAAEENVVWAYPTPFPEVGGLKGFVCFYHERVRVVTQERWPDGTLVTNRFPGWGDAAELLRLMDVEPVDQTTFVAPAYGQTDRNVLEGGQLLGDAIVAASKTIPTQRVTSASMIFSKAAGFDEAVDVAVDVLRHGRTFSTVEVRLSQAGSM